MWSVTKFEKRNGKTYPPKLCYAGVPMLVLARAQGPVRGNGYRGAVTQREAAALARRIARALNKGEK